MTDRDEALAETAVSPGPQRPTLDATAADPATASAVASLITKQIGRYRIERELGVGGMGIVYEVFDPDLERRVALKLILRATSEEGRARLLREARAMARLTHANIVRIYEIGSDQGREFVTMELVDGGSLADWLRSAPRSTGEIVDAFVAAGRGLAAAHHAGIVHRDFKPHNVLRDTSGRIVVGDFGLATGLEMQASAAEITFAGYTTLTATGSWVGTPAYMAPEQWNGGAITPATDQFAFCVALWEALAGTRPFRGDDVEQLRAAVTAGPAKLDMSKIPRRFRAVLRRGLAPDPGKRWPNMDALLVALRPDRRKIYLAFGAVAGLALSATVVALALRGPNSEPVTPQPPKIPSAAELESFERFAKTNFGERLEAEARRGVTDVQREISKALAKEANSDRVLLRQVRRMNNGKVKAPQDVIEELVDELKDGERVRLVPTSVEGKPIGLKAFALRGGTFVDAIGLSNGDVIAAIHGHPVTTSQELLAALEGVDSDAEHLELDIIRDGKRFTIVVAAQEDEPPETPIPPDPPGGPTPPKVRVFE